MRLLFTALASLLSIFNANCQNDILVNDFLKTANTVSIQEILNQYINSGYELNRNRNNEIIFNGELFFQNSKSDPVIYLTKTIHENPKGYGNARIGSVDKIIHIGSENINNENLIWKIETVISIKSYNLDSPVRIKNFFNKVETAIFKTVKKNGGSIMSSSIEFGCTDPFNVWYDLINSKKVIHNQNNISIKSGVSKVRDTHFMFIEVKNEVHCQFYESIILMGEDRNRALKSTFDKLKFRIDGGDIRKFDTNSLEGMVNVFLEDCKKNKLLINENQNISIIFEDLKDPIIALAYGLGFDNEIEIKVDPLKWEASSPQKKWYIIYHELGHDVLNLLHGQGGRMMFPVAEGDYEWDEFLQDKNIMFTLGRNHIKKN